MVYERRDRVGDVDTLRQWTLLPARRDALANVYRAMTRKVATETREDFLRLVYNEMWVFCRDEGYACPELVQAFLGRAVHLDSDMLKAILHQLLCRLLMQAACMPQCIKPCCCNCGGAPDDIACAKRVFVV